MQVNRFSGDNWTGLGEDSLSGHSSAQPLRTHELHGTALLVGSEKGGVGSSGAFRIHLSHFNFDLVDWASVNPCCAGGGDKHTCDIPRTTGHPDGRPWSF